MYYIHGGRGTGKTTYLIIQSAKTHVPIMVTNSARKGFIQNQAKRLGVSIPEPIVWNPGAHNDGLRVRDVLVDDGEDFLHHVLLYTVRARPVAMAISEQVVELPAKEDA